MANLDLAAQARLDRRLFEAVADDHPDEARKLCALGARADVFFGDTHALFIATGRGQLPLIEAILPHADPNLADDAGVTPLMLACGRENLGAIKLLLPACDPWQANDDGHDAVGLMIHRPKSRDTLAQPARAQNRMAIFRLFAQAAPRLLEDELERAPPSFRQELWRALSEVEALAIDQNCAAPSMSQARLRM